MRKNDKTLSKPGRQQGSAKAYAKALPLLRVAGKEQGFVLKGYFSAESVNSTNAPIDTPMCAHIETHCTRNTHINPSERASGCLHLSIITVMLEC